MATQVVCKHCGNKIEKSEAFCENILTKTKRYFCNEKCFMLFDKYAFDLYHNNQEYRDNEKLYETKIKNWISCNYDGEFKNYALIAKELKNIHAIAHNCKIYQYIVSNENYLARTIKRKGFNSEYGMVRYVFAILRNHFKEKETQKKSVNETLNTTFELYRPRKSIRPKRVGIVSLGG